MVCGWVEEERKVGWVGGWVGGWVDSLYMGEWMGGWVGGWVTLDFWEGLVGLERLIGVHAVVGEGGWVGGWVGDFLFLLCMGAREVEENEAVRMSYWMLGVGWERAHSNRLLLTHPPTHIKPTVAHSNRLVLLYLPIHPPTHPPTYRCWVKQRRRGYLPSLLQASR